MQLTPQGNQRPHILKRRYPPPPVAFSLQVPSTSPITTKHQRHDPHPHHHIKTNGSKGIVPPIDENVTDVVVNASCYDNASTGICLQKQIVLSRQMNSPPNPNSNPSVEINRSSSTTGNSPPVLPPTPTTRIDSHLRTFLTQIGWNDDDVTLLPPLHLTSLESITFIPLQKINYWLSICQDAARYLFEDLRVITLLMVIEKDYYSLYYLPWILVSEWDAAHRKYCDCNKNVTLQYHTIMVSNVPLSALPRKLPTSHHHTRAYKPRLQRAKTRKPTLQRTRRPAKRLPPRPRK